MLYGELPPNVLLLYTIRPNSTIIITLTHRIDTIKHTYSSD
jgi:hypothetical protein